MIAPLLLTLAAATTLVPTRVFDAVETRAGTIFIADQNKALRVSTDNGATFNLVPGFVGQARSGALVENELGELLVGTSVALGAQPSIYVCTPTACKFAGNPPEARDAVTGFVRQPGGVVLAINGHSQVMHRSTDQGHSWAVYTPKLPAPMGQAYTIEQDPVLGLLIGGEIGAVGRSVDGGKTWTNFGLMRHSPGVPGEARGNLWALTTDPVTGVVLAAINDDITPGNPGAAGSIQRHLPTDPDGVWHLTTGTYYDQIATFAVQPDGSLIASGIYPSPNSTGHVYKSNDAGGTWTEISSTIGIAFRGSVRTFAGPSGRLYFSYGLALARSPVGGYCCHSGSF